MSHTPGPWDVPHFARQDVNCDCRSVVCESFAGAICTIGIDNGELVGNGGNDAPPLCQAIANAHLIAAAPDLLAALKVLIDCYGSGGTAEQFVRRIEEYGFINDARTAIAHAEGTQ